ncbi:molybdenum cofactor biosynthesis protein MoaE [Geothrix sp. 21YS21S-4]|uniref:molybdenum cofactor biosynthesis protein MoaE n=1 Tax=Geothrix sp. 21YS21S-4 TaxID=3068889 RepID=UPI0027B8C703|nr:molybdenum cofactor biosynthesis protein MoaE [Geothrix sp. 21YS21S-4]
MIPFISVQKAPLDPNALRTVTADPRAGAFVLFEGRVRDHHAGRAVAELAYEAYVPMAEKELARLRDEAIERHGLLRCAVHHRIGCVPIGEPAVLVAVASVHRAEAFEAAAWLMDEIKRRVPIWKRETYGDGSESWVDCAYP